MKYTDIELKEIIIKLVNSRCEGDFWDFKEKWHKNIEDLIKDIVCFCNTVHYNDCFIIFGISDNYEIKGIAEDPNRRTQACILDTLSSIQFANNRSPDVELKSIRISSERKICDIDVIIINNIDSTPIYLDRQYGKMRKGCIYTRTGDKNTPDNGNANYAQIRDLWKKQFNLLRTDLDYVYAELNNKNNWVYCEEHYYHKFRPELTIECQFNYADSRDSTEFYSYTQCNPTTTFGKLKIKLNETTIYARQIVSLDSGQLLVPVPEWEFVNNKDNTSHESIAFKYYCKGTLLYRLLEFLYDSKNSEEETAFKRFEKVILFFEDEEEKDNFVYGVSCRFDQILELSGKSKEFTHIKSSFSNSKQQENYLKILRLGVILKEKLEIFRTQKYF